MKGFAKCGVCVAAAFFLSAYVLEWTGSLALFCGVRFVAGVVYAEWMNKDGRSKQ